jgi:hypothetical protein
MQVLLHWALRVLPTPWPRVTPATWSCPSVAKVRESGYASDPSRFLSVCVAGCLGHWPDQCLLHGRLLRACHVATHPQVHMGSAVPGGLNMGTNSIVGTDAWVCGMQASCRSVSITVCLSAGPAPLEKRCLSEEGCGGLGTRLFLRRHPEQESHKGQRDVQEGRPDQAGAAR